MQMQIVKLMSAPETAERLSAELEQLVDLSDLSDCCKLWKRPNPMDTDRAALRDPRIHSVGGR